MQITGINTNNAVVLAGDGAFRTIAEVKSFLDSVPDVDRYRAETQVLEQMLKYRQRSGDLIKEVFRYVESSGAYRQSLTKEEFADTWLEVLKIIKENKACQNRLGKAT